jgi:hypothetical protein
MLVSIPLGVLIYFTLKPLLGKVLHRRQVKQDQEDVLI